MGNGNGTKKKILSVEEFEALYKENPAGVVGCWVSKESFFKLTPLVTMTDEGAAEATFQRWLQSGRVVQERHVEEDPTGLTEDKEVIYIEARFVNSERRRDNRNKAVIAKSKELAVQDLAPAFRN